MAEYYEKETLLDFVKNNTPKFGDTTTMQCVEKAIKEAPTVDAVEVVRCIDCKYYHTSWDGKETHYCEDYWCEWVDPSLDDFCSLGERRSDNG